MIKTFSCQNTNHKPQNQQLTLIYNETRWGGASADIITLPDPQFLITNGECGSMLWSICGSYLCRYCVTFLVERPVVPRIRSIHGSTVGRSLLSLSAIQTSYTVIWGLCSDLGSCILVRGWCFCVVVESTEVHREVNEYHWWILFIWIFA